MAWEQDLPPSIVIWLIRELLRLRRREGPQLRQPLGVIVKDCGGQLLETHRRQGARDLEKWQQGKGKKKGKSSPDWDAVAGEGHTYRTKTSIWIHSVNKQGPKLQLPTRGGNATHWHHPAWLHPHPRGLTRPKGLTRTGDTPSCCDRQGPRCLRFVGVGRSTPVR